MKADTPQVATARIEAETARGRLMATAQELQLRLSPRTLARDAWEGAKIKGADLAEDAVDEVRRRPAVYSGIAAALMLFLAREPLMDLAGKAKRSKGSKSPRKTKTSSKQQDEKTETVE